MKFTFTCKKVALNDSVKEYAEKKISKLDRYFREDADAIVTFAVEKDNRCVVEGNHPRRRHHFPRSGGDPGWGHPQHHRRCQRHHRPADPEKPHPSEQAPAPGRPCPRCSRGV